LTPLQQIQLAEAIQSIYDRAPVPACWTLLDRTFIPVDRTPTSLVLRDNATGKIAQAVRGSETGWDWRADFSFLFRPSPFGVGRTEVGFTAYYDLARTESGAPLPAIDWFGGHSLGGPGATFFGCGPANPGGADILLVATPEPGDQEFSTWASPRFGAVHRWENPHDAVPDAPGRFLGYRDLVGLPLVVDLSILGVDVWDLPGNHHLPSYIAAFKRLNGIAP
jgi:hypothetical protein